MMIINAKHLLKITKVAMVTKEYIEEELAEANIAEQDFLTLDIEQAEKLMQIFTVSEVLSMMSNSCVAKACLRLKNEAYGI